MIEMQLFLDFVDELQRRVFAADIRLPLNRLLVLKHPQNRPRRQLRHDATRRQLQPQSVFHWMIFPTNVFITTLFVSFSVTLILLLTCI